MRIPLVLLAGASLLAGCGSTTRVVYVPTPVPANDPVPEPAPVPPIGISIVRSDDDRLLVSTNQPAYVAVFEIVPGRGVSLVYPMSPRQRQLALSGSSWLSLAHHSPVDSRSLRDEVWERASGRTPTRYMYALASDRPLRLADGAFDDEYLREVVGVRATRSSDPYETVEALSRRFVTASADEDWGEDLYTMDAGRREVTVRIAKVYCPDGSVVYVRDEMADRGSCPWRGRGRGTYSPPPRPDSVVASTGRPIVRRNGPPMRPPIFRVPQTRPVDVEGGVQQQGGSARGDSASDHRGGRDRERGDHKDNGRHNGWENGRPGNNGNQEKADKEKADKEKADKEKRDKDAGAGTGNSTRFGHRLTPRPPEPVQPSSRTETAPVVTPPVPPAVRETKPDTAATPPARRIFKPRTPADTVSHPTEP